MISIAARPIFFDVSTSGTGRTVIRTSLMVSLAKSGRRISAARAVARVVLPLPGGPVTTTNKGAVEATPQCCPEFLMSANRRLGMISRIMSSLERLRRI
jgi:hypothetical protein